MIRKAALTNIQQKDANAAFPKTYENCCLKTFSRDDMTRDLSVAARRRVCQLQFGKSPI
jgi:hypothetical protein